MTDLAEALIVIEERTNEACQNCWNNEFAKGICPTCRGAGVVVKRRVVSGTPIRWCEVHECRAVYSQSLCWRALDLRDAKVMEPSPCRIVDRILIDPKEDPE